MLNLTLPLQDDSLPSNLLTVHKMELVFSFGTHSHIWPEGLIYITGNVIPVQAALEETPRHSRRRKPPPWPGAVGPGPVGSVRIPSTSKLKIIPQ